MCEVTFVAWENGPISYIQSNSETVTTIRATNSEDTCGKFAEPVGDE